MTLPAQIQKQIDDAKSIVAQHYGTPEEPKADTTVENEAPAAEAPAAQATVTEAPRAEKPVTQTEDENNPTFAQRWRSLQGVYNATKQRLDESSQRIATLEQMMATMQTAAPAARSVEAPSQTLVTDDDVKDYGADMVSFARRVAREEIGPIAHAMAALARQVEQLQGLAPTVQRVVQSQNKSTEEVFFEKLGTQVSDWAAVNDDPRFHEWLLTPDAMTGITRQTYLADAQSSFDLARVVNIFKAFKQAAGIVERAQPASDKPPTQTAQERLAKQVAPGRASAATTPPAAKAPKQYTRADITSFYKNKMSGAFKGREAEAEATERDIFQAQREGRITA